MPPALDVDALRSHFPSLTQTSNGRAPIFFDNPGGTQVAREVIDAVNDYYLNYNANHGGVFATSIRSDAILRDAPRSRREHRTVAGAGGARRGREMGGHQSRRLHARHGPG